MLLSIIITHWNEPEGVLIKTLQSLAKTVKDESIEVIIVDDHSKVVPSQSDLQSATHFTFPIRVFTLKTRSGHAAARQFGAKQAIGDWIMFTDAHMIFEYDWMYWLKHHIHQSDKREVFCGPYLSSKIEYELDKKSPVIFHGARFYFWEQNSEGLSIIDSKPFYGSRTKIECVIGANYFMHRTWFYKIGMLPGIYGWSSADEWMLSVKSWLCGGSVNIVPKLKIRHILYPTGLGETGYGKDMKRIELLTNRLSAAYQVLEPKTFDRFIKAIRIKAPADNNLYDEAMDKLGVMPEVEEARRYLTNQFIYDCDWLCNKFNIQHPDNLIHI